MYNLTNFRKACQTNDINLIEQVFYLLPKDERLNVYSLKENSEIRGKIIELYQENLSDAESLVLFEKTRIDLGRFNKKDMELLGYVLDDNIPEIKKSLIDPEVNPGFYDQVIIRNAPSLIVGELLTVHPLVDPCCLLNDQCLNRHHITQEVEYYAILNILQEIHKIYLKSLCADEENKKLYQVMISEMTSLISSTRITTYLNFIRIYML